MNKMLAFGEDEVKTYTKYSLLLDILYVNNPKCRYTAKYKRDKMPKQSKNPYIVLFVCR